MTDVSQSEDRAQWGKLQNYIDGEWVDATATECFDVVNPATGEILAQTPMSSSDDVDRAVQAAQDVFMEWRETSPVTRARYMFRLKNLMEDDFDRLARVVVIENGKTLDEARGEVRRAIEMVETAAGIPSLMMGYNLEDGAASGIDEEVLKQPMGVFAAICPFNFPFMVSYWFWPFALACGNTYVVKPSEMCPLSTQVTFELIEKLDLPPGVINMVHGGKDVVESITDHPLVQGISFVGSTPIGRIVYERSAAKGKRVQAQAGAKNCLVVMPDANLDRSLPNMISSFYGCAGQRCLAGSILIAVGDIYQTLAERFVEGAKQINVGYGLEERSMMGPVVTMQSRDRIIKMIERGVEQGAKLLLDGRGLEVEGYPNGSFIGPTVFDEVKPEMEIFQEEVFGPVCSIVRAQDLDEAIELVNSLPFGNASSIYTDSGAAARQYRYEVEAGNIGINVGVAAAMSFFPFGGFKDSFFGDIHGQGRDSIEFFTDRKTVITRWF